MVPPHPEVVEAGNMYPVDGSGGRRRKYIYIRCRVPEEVGGQKYIAVEGRWRIYIYIYIKVLSVLSIFLLLCLCSDWHPCGLSVWFESGSVSLWFEWFESGSVCVYVEFESMSVCVDRGGGGGGQSETDWRQEKWQLSCFQSLGSRRSMIFLGMV